MNVALDIPEDCSWIKEVRTKALSSSTFELLVEANDAERREGKVSVVNWETGWFFVSCRLALCVMPDFDPASLQ